MDKTLGMIVFLVSLTFLASKDISIFLLLGIASAISLLSKKYFRSLLFISCSLYLSIVIPPLCNIAVSSGNLIHVIKISTETIFKNGFAFDKVLILWHLYILPPLVFFIFLFLVFQTLKFYWVKSHGNT